LIRKDPGNSESGHCSRYRNIGGVNAKTRRQAKRDARLSIEAPLAFLTRKWAREHDCRLIKELWEFAATAWPCASATRGTMRWATGSAAMAMSTENSPQMV